MNVKGRTMIFRSPSGELYINPWSLKPVAIYALAVHCETILYDEIVSHMDDRNMAFFEFEGVQEDDYSLTLSAAYHRETFKVRYSTRRPMTVALDFEYHTVYKGRELTPYELDGMVNDINDDVTDYTARMAEFKNALVLKPLLLCGTDSHDNVVFDIRATRQSTIDDDLRKVFTHELSDIPIKGWVYNARCEFEIIIPILLKAGYEAVEKFAIAEKRNQMMITAKGSTYYSLEVLSWRPMFHPDANLFQPSYVKDVYRDLYRLVGSGSLKSNAKSFRLKDHYGNVINKNEWDWTDPNNSPYNDDGTLKELFVDYCKQDCVVTYHLLREFNKTVMDTNELDKADLHECITAGGIAKRVAINSMMREQTKATKYAINYKAFSKALGLYSAPDDILHHVETYKAVKGGLGYFNAKYYDQLIEKAVYSDISSAYPHIMSQMAIPTYEGLVVNKSKDRVPGEIGSLLIIRIRSLKLKPGYAPPLYDYESKFLMFDYSSNSYFITLKDEILDYPVFSYNDPDYDELKFIEEAYEIDYDIKYAYHFQDSGLRFGEYIQKFYDLKQSMKGVNDALSLIAKLILNSSYGKMCQNMFLTKTTYRLENDILVADVHQIAEDSEEYKKEFKASALRVVGGFITSMQRTRLGRKAHELFMQGKTIYLLATDCVVYSYDDEEDTKVDRLGEFDILVIKDFTGWSQKGYKYIKPKEMKPEKRYNLHMNGIDTDAYANTDKFYDFQPGIFVPTAVSTRIEGGNVVLQTNKFFQVKKDEEILLTTDLG